MTLAVLLYMGHIPRIFAKNLLYSQKTRFRVPKTDKAEMQIFTYQVLSCKETFLFNNLSKIKKERKSSNFVLCFFFNHDISFYLKKTKTKKKQFTRYI